MDILLNNGIPAVYYDNSVYKLKELLTDLDSSTYQLPLIVNIVSLNNYGRSIKNILIKNTPLLLLKVDQLDSVIADYYGSYDGRSSSQRSRLTLSQSKMMTKSSTTVRTMKKLSKSVASLSAANQKGNNTNDDDYPHDDDDDENAYNLRTFIKLLNEKRSSSVSLCRIPCEYRSFFELLNANDQPIEPYYKLGDLPKIEYDDNDSVKRSEKTPIAVFLRSSCNAYTKKETYDQRSTLTVSVDSCYDSSSSDLDLHKHTVILNDDSEILHAGQTLVILDDCYAIRTQIPYKEIRQHKPSSPSSPHFSPTNWMRATTSRLFSSKKHRQSNHLETIFNENIRRKSTPESYEHYVRCRTEQNNIVYISVDEPALFSLHNREKYCSELKTRMNYIDISDVFQIKDILSNFRFPINVRLLDGPLSFDNIYAPAVINRNDTSCLTPTKLRLLGLHNERIVFACPLNKVSLKAAKTSLPYIVLPLSVNADIEIQPCTNMNEILRTSGFRKIIKSCAQIIQYYHDEITLVHFPLSLTIDRNQRKRGLYKKRSHSASYTEPLDEEFRQRILQSAEQLNNRRRHSDELSFLTAYSLHNRESEDTVKQKSSLDTAQQQTTHRPRSRHVTIKDNRKEPYSPDIEPTSEDQVYEDLDKIYDYIRTGSPSDDVKKIIAEHKRIIPKKSATKKQNRQSPAASPTPEKLGSNRFLNKIDNCKSDDPDLQFHPCKDDGYVDNEQAHALFIASKERKSEPLQQDLSAPKPTTKMKRISRS
ncbi:unnamed protein product [Adineta steineri]|uniref:CABIT domain-containing protein n=1 Tax=Adineta steineri TaxID=433720 RepID=A0A819R7K1_9BILA|nr:unnamed protein product [Adineta steineri]